MCIRDRLLEDSRDFKRSIPEMIITDYPILAYRAIHFDTKHHLNRMEYYYKAMDRLARYKINAVIWELEDKLRYIRRPEIGAPNAISKEEMLSLIHISMCIRDRLNVYSSTGYIKPLKI